MIGDLKHTTNANTRYLVYRTLTAMVAGGGGGRAERDVRESKALNVAGVQFDAIQAKKARAGPQGDTSIRGGNTRKQPEWEIKRKKKGEGGKGGGRGGLAKR